MSNYTHAVAIIMKATKHPERAHDAVEELDGAGLLAPDVPEPRIDLDGWQEWGHERGNSVALENGEITVYIPDDISRDLTPAEARELAAWLNAAADYSERKGNQE